jgi:hypothetical protein
MSIGAALLLVAGRALIKEGGWSTLVDPTFLRVGFAVAWPCVAVGCALICARYTWRDHRRLTLLLMFPAILAPLLLLI